MIFGTIEHEDHYSEVYYDLLKYINKKYQSVESGLQGDAWIWITDNNDKVALDTFTSMNFEIKCENKNSTLVISIINYLKQKYQINVLPEPELEAHE